MSQRIKEINTAPDLINVSSWCVVYTEYQYFPESNFQAVKTIPHWFSSPGVGIEVESGKAKMKTAKCFSNIDPNCHSYFTFPYFLELFWSAWKLLTFAMYVMCWDLLFTFGASLYMWMGEWIIG